MLLVGRCFATPGISLHVHHCSRADGSQCGRCVAVCAPLFLCFSQCALRVCICILPSVSVPVPCRCVSLVLRGANEFLLDEMDRAMHDALCVVQRVLESKALVAGGGAVEAALSIYLDAFATTLGTKEQLAIREFAEALLVIPKTLAVNAAQDATELVAKLCAFHHASQAGGPAGMSAAGGAGAAAGGAGAASAGAAASVPGMEDKADLRFMGLDLVNGKVSQRGNVLVPGLSLRRVRAALPVGGRAALQHTHSQRAGWLAVSDDASKYFD